MNILVIGCGKVGSQLSNTLSKMGHDVAVIDDHPEHFDNLSDDFSGYTVSGIPIDQDVLRHAGIEGCDALAAVTDDDNTNLMACQLAGEIFKVPRVLARIFDPQRETVFSQFGLHTVCPTNLSVNAMYTMLTGHDQLQSVCIDSSTVAFESAEASEKQIGKRLFQLLGGATGTMVLFGLLHTDGRLTLAHAGCNEIVREHDHLIYAKVID